MIKACNVREAHTIKGPGVATEQPLASAAALKVLASGGNAIDASITASLTLAVTIPHMGGVGGDYFALIHTPEGRIDYIDGAGYSPSRLTRDLLLEKGYDRVPSNGPLSVTVPGMIDALYNMWRKYGSLDWETLVEPAAQLAEKGFPAHPALVKAIKASSSLLEADPGSRATYLVGAPSKPGDTVRFPGLARLLREIAEDPRSLYEGDIAEEIARYVESRGGVLRSSDLSGYRAEWGTPISLEYRGWRIWEMPPSTQGVTTLHILSILEEWRLPADPVERFHYILRAAYPAYRVRDEEVGDPRHMRLPVKALLSPEYVGALKAEALEERHCRARPPAGGGDTTYYSVADSEGYIVSGIQSLFHPFGSGVTEPTYQVTLQARASGFTVSEGKPNTVAPMKKPLHTLSAVVAESRDVIVALGASGGHYRPQQHALMLTSIVDHAYTIGEAIAAPRVLWDPWTCSLVADEGVDPSIAPAGYTLQHGRTGVGNAIMIRGSTLTVATDPRGDGYPAVLV